jgi:selenide,water dikinase
MTDSSIDLFALDCECGCAAKVPADRLTQILRDVGLPDCPELIVGPETLDDAGVYRLPNGQCLVQTVDFFPPVARTPYMYGQIAAANALSDVYAMGGRPLTAMAIVCFPAERLPPQVLKEITRGAVDKMREAGVVLVGGHSIVDPQPKYGLAVTGLVDEDALLDNAHARPGDALILTKPLGTGTTLLAAKGGLATQEQEDAMNRSMAALNGPASDLARAFGASACTDVTGFGLLGHGVQLARAGGVSLEIHTGSLPVLDGALAFARTGLLSAATYANRDAVGGAAAFDADVAQPMRDLLFDPQTSGGLLIACPAARAQDLLAEARKVLSTPCGFAGRVVEAPAASRVRVLARG